jgi:hypothetical protein
MNTPYTEEQKDGFKGDFARRRRRHIGGFVATVVSMLLVIALPGSRLTLPFGPGTPPLPFIIGLIFIVSSWVNWRCPACRKMLSGELSPRFCSRCGVELR